MQPDLVSVAEDTALQCCNYVHLLLWCPRACADPRMSRLFSIPICKTFCSSQRPLQPSSGSCLTTGPRRRWPCRSTNKRGVGWGFIAKTRELRERHVINGTIAVTKETRLWVKLHLTRLDALTSKDTVGYHRGSDVEWASQLGGDIWGTRLLCIKGAPQRTKAEIGNNSGCQIFGFQRNYVEN